MTCKTLPVVMRYPRRSGGLVNPHQTGDGGQIAHQRKSTLGTDFHRVTDQPRWDNIFSQSVSLTQYVVLSICLSVRLFQLAS